MSRRRGEFEHRTSIFEGAFRAWSHLGGLDPDDLESRPVSDLDPLNNPIGDDSRMKNQRKGNSAASQNPDGSHRRQYPYEPLPRSGLAHPYVQAILSPWLGPDADNDAIQLGLTTLRTWWQHRRKGESGSAIAALGTEKMKGVVEGYTRHFFTLAHCLIMNDKEQPPRTLHAKMKELEKVRSKKSKRRAREEEAGKIHQIAINGAADGLGSHMNGAAAAVVPVNGMHNNSSHPQPGSMGIDSDLTDSSMSPLERLHAAQRRQLAESGGVHTTIGTNNIMHQPSNNGGGGNNNSNNNGNAMNTSGNTNNDIMPNSNGVSTSGNANPIDPSVPLIHIKQKCMPGKVDLPAVARAVNHHATQLVHRGGGAGASSGATPNAVTSSGGNSLGQYGDPNNFPIVFLGNTGDILLSMAVDGITCAHCVKIVETVLKGCNGNKSPIDGLLDAAADRALCSVLIKIDRISSAKRIAFEAARNLAMVGYTAKAKEIDVSTTGSNGKKAAVEVDVINNAINASCSSDPRNLFNWTLSCTCPDNGVLRDDCARHSQMDNGIFDAFDSRGRLITEYITNGKLSSMDSSVGGDNGMMNVGGNNGNMQQNNQMQLHNNHMNAPNQQHQMLNDTFQQPLMGNDNNNMNHPQGMGQGNNNNDMGYYGNNGGNMGNVPSAIGGGLSHNNLMDHNNQHQPYSHHQQQHHNHHGMGQMPMRASMAQRASIISFGGNGLRSMSFASEAASFGRAMSGLSALSIDWENMDDFDINVDHSSHITNDGPANRFPGAGGNDNNGPPDTVGVTVTGGPGGDQNGGNNNNNSGGGGPSGPIGGRGGRRSSIRRSFMASGQDAHVSFKV